MEPVGVKGGEQPGFGPTGGDQTGHEHARVNHDPANRRHSDFLQRRSNEAYKNRLVRQLERMGHKATLEPAQAA